MPNYYNPYMNAYPFNYSGAVVNTGNYPIQTVPQQVQQPQYMINVGGENSAKAWQPSAPPQPNTIIPLFDSDGQHVYFKTFDAYGRMNPIRKGRIVFDDEIRMSEEPAPVNTDYAKADEFMRLEQEVAELKAALQKQNNQNGSNNRGGERR